MSRQRRLGNTWTPVLVLIVRDLLAALAPSIASPFAAHLGEEIEEERGGGGTRGGSELLGDEAGVAMRLSEDGVTDGWRGGASTHAGAVASGEGGRGSISAGGDSYTPRGGRNGGSGSRWRMLEVLLGEVLETQRREPARGQCQAAGPCEGAQRLTSRADVPAVADVVDVNAPDVDGDTALHVACGHASLSLPPRWAALARAWLDRYAQGAHADGGSGDGLWEAVAASDDGAGDEDGAWTKEARAYWQCVARVVGMLMR